MASAFEPTVVVSKDGRRPVALIEFEGVHGIQNRDAVGFYFTIRTPSFTEASRIAVLFSGTSLMSTPAYFDLPDYKERDANFAQFALAAIGDHLDEFGFPEFRPSGVGAAQIEAFSGRFQEWKRRESCTDDEVLVYMKARLYWTWKYNIPRSLFTSHDLLRLGIEVADLHRLTQLEEGRLWRTHSKSSYGIALEPEGELLRQEKELLDPTPKHGQPTPIAPMAEPPKPELPPAEQPVVAATKRPPKKKRRGGHGRDASALVFVDEARLADLRQISSKRYDLRKLIAICDELNICFRSQCNFAVAALTRALLDHVPPVFGVTSFAQVANNYAGTKSFKGSMQHLESSARNIADGHLHTHVRKAESLPTRTQVNFSSDVDVLLAEVVRLLASEAS